MQVKITADNEKLIEDTAKVFHVTPDEIVGRCLTYYRAHKYARQEEYMDKCRPENKTLLSLEFNHLLKGKKLFLVLYQLFRKSFVKEYERDGKAIEHDFLKDFDISDEEGRKTLETAGIEILLNYYGSELPPIEHSIDSVKELMEYSKNNGLSTRLEEEILQYLESRKDNPEPPSIEKKLLYVRCLCKLYQDLVHKILDNIDSKDEIKRLIDNFRKNYTP